MYINTTKATSPTLLIHALQPDHPALWKKKHVKWSQIPCRATWATINCHAPPAIVFRFRRFTHRVPPQQHATSDFPARDYFRKKTPRRQSNSRRKCGCDQRSFSNEGKKNCAASPTPSPQNKNQRWLPEQCATFASRQMGFRGHNSTWSRVAARFSVIYQTEGGVRLQK